MTPPKPPGGLSTAHMEPSLVERIYDNMASVYDLAFGATMQQGRRRAVDVMALEPCMHVLEVGVGTGLNLALYPESVHVTAIDCSTAMLDRAAERCDQLGIHARLLPMDAQALRFSDDSFDAVYAPYVISVVPDPVKVLREMYRVCRPGGRVVVLSHFRSERPWLARVERWLSPLTVRIGFTADLSRDALFAAAGLSPASIEMVNRPRIWTLATFLKP